MPDGVGWKDVAVPRPYPREFRDDVVRVARNREDGVTIEQIATDFGIPPHPHEAVSVNAITWRAAQVDADGDFLGVTGGGCLEGGVDYRSPSAFVATPSVTRL